MLRAQPGFESLDGLLRLGQAGTGLYLFAVEFDGLDFLPCEEQVRDGRSEEHTSELQSH